MDEFVTSQFPEQRDQRRYVDGIVTKIEGDIEGIKDALKDLAASVNRLAVVEERLGNTNQALERAFKALEKIEARISVLEKAAERSQDTTRWVDKAIYAIVAAAVMYVGQKVGFVK